MIAVTSTAPYPTDKWEHTALYKINRNVYIKNRKHYIVSLPPPPPHTHTHIHTRVRRRNVTWMKKGGRKKTAFKSLVVVLLVEVDL